MNILITKSGFRLDAICNADNPYDFFTGFEWGPHNGLYNVVGEIGLAVRPGIIIINHHLLVILPNLACQAFADGSGVGR